jgi:hypothetical protein
MIRRWYRCGALLLAACGGGGSSVSPPAAPPPLVIAEKVAGLNFSPYLDGQAPGPATQISENQLTARLQMLMPLVRSVRTYSTTHGIENVGRIAHSLGLNVTVGAFLSDDAAQNAREKANLIAAVNAGNTDATVILGCPVFGGATVADNWIRAIPGGAGTAELLFTAVPVLGAFDDLRGRLTGVDPAEYRVAVFIYVNDVWYPKPSFASPSVYLNIDGEWGVDITTGAADENATRIAAYLLPVSYRVPQLNGGSASIPAQIEANAVARREIPR